VLPEGTRAQELENLRQSLAPAAEQAGEKQQRHAKSSTSGGREPDPNRSWLRAGRGLVAFLKETEDEGAVLRRAGHWSPQTLKAYRDELQRVYDRVSTLVARFDRIAAEKARSGSRVSPDGAQRGLPSVGDETPLEGTAEAPVAQDAAEVAQSSERTTRTAENGTGSSPDEAQHVPSLLLAGSTQPDDTVDHAPEPADDADEESAGEEKGSDHRAVVTRLIQAFRNENYSWRAMAKRFNAKGVPTLSGKGQWNDRTIARFAERIGMLTIGMVDGC
jgi:hypothetical protein